jgi:hypothetical protein
MNSAAAIARFALVLAALALGSVSATAQGTEEQRSDCMGDAFKFCSADIPNVSAIEACLKSNEARLTPACRAEFHPTTRRTRIRREHFR